MKERITDIRTMIEDPTSQFSEKQMADLIAQAGVSRDEIRAQLKKAFDVLTGKMGKSYTYDSQGRPTKIVLHLASPGDVSRTSAFNDLGDVVEEQTLLTTNPRIPAGVGFHLDEAGDPVPLKPASEWPPQPEFPSRSVHYTYQCDSYGNWIEQTVSCSDSPP